MCGGVTKGDIGNSADVGGTISGVGLGEICSRSHRESYRNPIGSGPESECGCVRDDIGAGSGCYRKGFGMEAGLERESKSKYLGVQSVSD